MRTTHLAGPTDGVQQRRVLVTPEPGIFRRHVVVLHIQPLAHDLVHDGDLHLRDPVLVHHLQVQAALEAGFKAVADFIAVVGGQGPGARQPFAVELLPVAVLLLYGLRGDQRLAPRGGPAHGVHLVRAERHPEILRVVLPEALVAQQRFVAKPNKNKNVKIELKTNVCKS